MVVKYERRTSETKSSRASVVFLLCMFSIIFSKYTGSWNLCRQMERLCYSLLGVKWKMCRGIQRATSVGLRRPIAERQRETVRKLSPYDVFPPSQRRFRRDTRGAKRAAFLWEWWKTGGKEREQPTPKEKREWAKGGGERRRVWETLSLLLHFICVWHHTKQGDFAKWVEWMNVEIYWSFPFLSCGINAAKAKLLYLNYWRDDFIAW